ncbi:hypothetical protein GAMM_40298 [Gammaproteobacteria bacterium]
MVKLNIKIDYKYISQTSPSQLHDYINSFYIPYKKPKNSGIIACERNKI